MRAVAISEIVTARLTLRPLQPDHAHAFWPVLSDPALYRWISRRPPASPADLEARFSRIAQRTAPDRADQWVNWTVWARSDGAALGLVEATLPPDQPVSIAYMFASTVWGQGFATEAMQAAMAALEDAGPRAFQATIDTRNAASRALAAKLGFHHVETRPSDDIIAGAPSEEEVWRYDVANVPSL